MHMQSRVVATLGSMCATRHNFILYLVVLTVACAGQHAYAVPLIITTPASPTVAQLQAYINNINSGTDPEVIIKIPPGETDFGANFLKLNKWGASLQGAGPGETVFKSSQNFPDVVEEDVYRHVALMEHP
jgi:hypothetical protein